MKEIIRVICLLSAIIFVRGLRTRIFNGSNAPEGKYPYHALIKSRPIVPGIPSSDTYCGGSIINKRWILTAAHCFHEDDIRNIEVEVGSIFRTRKRGTFYRVVERMAHEDFDFESHINDIALLRTDKDIAFNDKVQPIQLASRDTKIRDDEKVVFTGFGKIKDLTNPEILQSVELKMYSYKKCKKVERRMIETQICTLPKGSTRGKGACVGDSGEALVNKNGIQVGINSHSYGGADLNTCGKVVDVYTRVSSYRDWIDETIK